MKFTYYMCVYTHVHECVKLHVYLQEGKGVTTHIYILHSCLCAHLDYACMYVMYDNVYTHMIHDIDILIYIHEASHTGTYMNGRHRSKLHYK